MLHGGLPWKSQSCDLMKKDVLQGQCIIDLFSVLCWILLCFTPLPPSYLWNVLACWNSHHTALPQPRGPPWFLLFTSFLYQPSLFFSEITSATTEAPSLFLLEETPPSLCFSLSHHSIPFPVCGVNFHYTPWRYNDLKWASNTEVCRFCFPSLIFWYTCLALDVNVCFASFFLKTIWSLFVFLGFCLRIFFLSNDQVDGHLFYFSFLPPMQPSSSLETQDVRMP